VVGCRQRDGKKYLNGKTTEGNFICISGGYVGLRNINMFDITFKDTKHVKLFGKKYKHIGKHNFRPEGCDSDTKGYPTHNMPVELGIHQGNTTWVLAGIGGSVAGIGGGWKLGKHEHFRMRGDHWEDRHWGIPINGVWEHYTVTEGKQKLTPLSNNELTIKKVII